MTTKLQIGQSLRIVHAALATHLESFRKITNNVVSCYLREDPIGIRHFDLSLREEGYEGSNLGSIKLRSLGSKLTEMIMEDSVWLNSEPNLVKGLWDKGRVSVKKRKASYERIQSIHRELRDYVIQALKEDRLVDTGVTEARNLSQQHVSTPNASTRVFISYAHEDIESATKLYRQLKGIGGVNPWFDKESLLPGMKWRPAIKKAIRESDFFLALLSKKSTSKRGYVQTEMKEALDIWDEFPEGKAYLIPIRLNECEPSYEKLREVQFQDFFPNWDSGFEKVVQVLSSTARPNPTTSDSLSKGYEYRCAIVDLDNGLMNLPQICRRLNSIQHFFHFSCPSFPFEHTALEDFEGQINLYVPHLPQSFYGQKSLLNADLVVCLSKYLLADTENGITFWDNLSLPSDDDNSFKFITTYGLYDKAKKAGCTFEKSCVYHVITQLLIHFASDLVFHIEVRACIFDYCKEHAWMIKGMKRMRLCRSCLKKVENEELKKAALAILADPLRV